MLPLVSSVGMRDGTEHGMDDSWVEVSSLTHGVCFPGFICIGISIHANQKGLKWGATYFWKKRPFLYETQCQIAKSLQAEYVYQVLDARTSFRRLYALPNLFEGNRCSHPLKQRSEIPADLFIAWFRFVHIDTIDKALQILRDRFLVLKGAEESWGA